MFELITTYPIIFGICFLVVIWLIKSHFLASTNDMNKLKDKIVEDLLKNKTFVTTEQLSMCENLIRRDVKNEFLSLAVFNEFKTGIDHQFKNVFTRFDEGTKQFGELNKGINEIKDYLIKEKRR